MRPFTLILQDAMHIETVDGLVSFVGEDRSGSFGILPGHARMMTTLTMGLARYRLAEGAWQYLAQPGAVLYFNNNVLSISTRHYFRDENYLRISEALREKLMAEEQALQSIKTSLHHMEEEILRQMWELRRAQGPVI